MDVILKKYFWVVTLTAVGLCASLLGSASSHIIEQVAFSEDDASAAQPPRRFTPPPDPHSKDTGEIVHRNVFCSSCSPIVPTADTGGGGDTSGPQSNVPQKTSLQIELVSTMVVPTDERWSMAVIRDLSTKEKDSAMYHAGSKLPDGNATVLRVVEKKVYLSNTGRIEFIDIEGAAPPPAPTQQPVVAAGEDEGIGNHVRCNGAACEVDRALVDQILANPTALATAARFVPSIKDGHPNGFKLYAIRPSSIFGRIGLQNGDTIKSINGMDMTSPDQALSVYTKLRNATHLSVTVERKNESQTLDYTIR